MKLIEEFFEQNWEETQPRIPRETFQEISGKLLGNPGTIAEGTLGRIP